MTSAAANIRAFRTYSTALLFTLAFFFISGFNELVECESDGE